MPNEILPEPKKESSPLAEITADDIASYKIINQDILNTIFCTYNDNKQKKQENQPVNILRIPKPRHYILDKILTKLGFQPRQWKHWETIATNHKFKLQNNDILNIYVKNNINKETDIIYVTTAGQILKLQDFGQTRSEALTAKVIEAVGHYNVIVADRRIDADIVTNKTSLKKHIVRTVQQQQARLLQPIERLICNYHNKDEATYKNEVKQAFVDYMGKLDSQLDAIITITPTNNQRPDNNDDYEAALKKLNIDQDTLNDFLKYNPQFLQTLQAKLQELKNDAQKFHNLVDSNSATDISTKLQSFLRYNLNEIVRGAQEQNDQITWNSNDSLFRGKLREYLVDADKVISSYVFDQHNPITHGHQSDFRTDPNGTNRIVYHSKTNIPRNRKGFENLLYAITTLEDEDKGNKPKVVKSASWNHYAARTNGQILRRLGASFLTFIPHIFLGIFNIPWVALTGSTIIADFMQKIENKINDFCDIKDDYEHNFYKFSSKIGVNKIYTSTIIGNMLNKVVSELTAFILQTPQLIKHKMAEQFNLLKNDMKTGYWSGRFKPSPVPSNNKVDLSDDEKKKLQEWLLPFMKDAQALNSISSFTEAHYAQPQQHLDPYYPQGIVSIVYGIEGFVNLFKDDVFEKDPVMASGALLAYLAGGVAVLNPMLFQLVLVKIGCSSTQIPQIIETFQAIGKFMGNGNIGEAISAGFTSAQAVGVALNTATKGLESKLADMLNDFRHDPLIYAAVGVVAYGVGYGFTEKIPVVSESLKEEIGNKYFGRVLIGAKVGLIGLEAAIPEDEEQKSILAHFFSDIAETLLIIARIVCSVVTWSKQPYIDLGKQILRSVAAVVYALNRISVLLAQMIIPIPKTILEVATTILVNIQKLLLWPFARNNGHTLLGGYLIKGKDSLLHLGYRLGFQVREKIARGLDRVIGATIKGLDKHKSSAESPKNPGINQQQIHALLLEISKQQSQSQLPQQQAPAVVITDLNQSPLSSLPTLINAKNENPIPSAPPLPLNGHVLVT
jgi:hypothetical protein